MMTKTIPRNDSTKQLNEIVDEIYHVKDPLNSPSRDRLREVLQHLNCWETTVLWRMKQEFFFHYWGLCEHNAEQ